MFLILIFVIVSLTLISAYFSASETAITAASKAKLHQLAKEGSRKAGLVKNLQKQIGLVISALLMGNTLINALAVSLATGLLIDIFDQEGVLGEILASMIMGGFLILYAEVTPKILAVHQPEKILLSTASLLHIIFKIMRPITVAINFIARQSLRLIGVKTRSDITSHTSIAELRGLIDMHQGPGQDVIHERAMLKSILDLRSVQLSEIMVHRKNITMINASDPFETIVDQILASPFTRIPLWKNDPDNIVGVINAKVLLRAVRAHKDKLEELDILSLAHKPWFVPESTDLLEQLQAFRERREHFALVVDEYGSLMGIVTLEDILEEIVGDISDEHDIAVKGVRQQADGSYIIDGSVTIRDLNRQFDWGLSDESAATLAGLIIYETRKIPETGQIFMLNGFRFEILRRQRNQITLVRVTPPAALLEESEPSKITHEETS